MSQAPRPNENPASTDPTQTSRRLDCLLEVAQVVNSTLELEEVLAQILGQARTILAAESGSVMLLEPEEGVLRVVAAEGPRADAIRGRTQAADEGIAGWVASHGEPLLLHGAAAGPYRPVCDRGDLRDALCVPLRAEGQVLGALSVSNRVEADPFGPADLELLVALSSQAALAIRNARAFEQLREERKKVEALLDQVTQAQVDERQRLALLLHDGPAQTLYAALRNLDAVRVVGYGASEDVRRSIDGLELTIRQALAETRAVMVDLWPPRLEEQGLAAALQTYAQQFEKRTGIRTQFRRHGLDCTLPRPLETCLYRTVQESLTNVWKHAQAGSAEVNLWVEEKSCRLEIRDDGKGFDPTKLARTGRENLGLDSLKERAELLGGRFTVHCAPGKGTTVTISAPVAY